MRFSGFRDADFEVFSIPDFAGRIGAIRGSIRPALAALGEDLAPRIEAAAGPVHAHVAQHMRRRVNPPDETWVAFARDRKGYKRWTHYRVAVSARGVRVTVFVEDDADDKALFGAALEREAAGLLQALGPDAPIVWYTLGETPTPHGQITPPALTEVGRSLQRLKTLKFQAGIPLDRAAAAAMSPAAFEDWVIQQVERLSPLYRAGLPE